MTIRAFPLFSFHDFGSFEFDRKQDLKKLRGFRNEEAWYPSIITGVLYFRLKVKKCLIRSLPFLEPFFYKRENLGRSGDAIQRKQGGWEVTLPCAIPPQKTIPQAKDYNYAISCRNLAVLLYVNGSSGSSRATKQFLSFN